MKACNMASKKLLSKQEKVKKKLNSLKVDNKHFLLGENSNSTEFHHHFSMQNDSIASKPSKAATIFPGKSALPNDETAMKGQVSAEISSVDSNVNKQQIFPSQRGNTGFLPETPMKVKKGHVTFSEFGNSIAKDHAGDSEHIGTVAPHSLLPIEQPGYDGLVSPAEDWQHILNDTNKQSSSSDEQNQSKDSLLYESLPTLAVEIDDQEKINVSKEKPQCNELVEVSGKQTCIGNELVPKCTTDQKEVSATESLILQNLQATDELLPVDKANPEHKLYLEYQNRLDSLISQYKGEGQIVVHQSYPGIVEEGCLLSNYVPEACLCPIQEPACDLPYDDSVFPTTHRLSSSEDMRAAMMQARKHTYYRRKEDAAREIGFPEGVVALNETLRPNYSRFTRPARNNLQLKYRNVMATLKRRAFNDWKTEISATAGQTGCQKLGADENTKTDANAFLEKFAYLKCPRCHQRVSGIYGKPCPCQKVPYSLAPNRCNSSTQKRKGINNSTRASQRMIEGAEKRSVECTENAATLPQTTECPPSLHANCGGENETGRKHVNAGFLGDIVSEHGRKSNTAIKLSQPAGAAGEIPQFGARARDAGRWAPSSDTSRSAFSNKTSRMSLRGFLMSDPLDRTSRPLREWEINRLEATLRKCLS